MEVLRQRGEQVTPYKIAGQGQLCPFLKDWIVTSGQLVLFPLQCKKP